MYLWASLGVLVTQKTFWLIYYCYRNIGSAPGSRASVKVYPCSTPDETILQLEINVKRPWKALPGQYVNLRLPSSRLLGAGLLESHPFMVAWAAHDDRERLKTITILARSRNGFTGHLNVQNNMTRAILDGPYGGNETETLIKHDTILLTSSGIGLASHLNTARYLLLAHNAQTARLRRLTLVWLLDLPGTFTPPLPLLTSV
jgi:NAD(P)H-flavin reductase